MQGLKWRLSFNSSRPSRQLKRFWLDSNVRSTDTEMDFTRGKLLLIFLDAVLSNQNQQEMRSVVDELLEDIVPICSSLLHWLKLCEMKSSSTSALSTEETPLLVDIQAKLMIVTEMLVSTKGSKSCLRESIATTNPCIRYAVEALKAVDEVSQKLGLVRVLRNIIFTEAHLLELGNLGGFRILAEVTRASNSPALTTQVVHLHRLYLEFIQSAKLVQMLNNDPAVVYRTRAVSSSSTGSTPAGNLLSTTPRGTGLTSSHSKHFNSSSPSVSSSSQMLHHHQQHTNLHLPSPALNTSALHNNATFINDADSVDDSSIAAKGLNLAFNFVNELLKLSPISSEWLNGAGRKDKDNTMMDSLGAYLEEQNQVSAMLLASSVLDIETERVRAMEKSSEQLPGAVSDGEEFQLEDEHSRLYSRKSSSPMHTHGKAIAPRLWTNSDTGAAGLEADRSSGGQSETALPAPRSPNHLGKQPIWLPHLVDPLDHIRDQMADQDMLSVLLLAMEKAASPTDALEVLLTVQAMLLNDTAAQSSFLSANGYACLSSMVLRVEENLVLLAPCSDVSMAAASGQQQHRMSLSSVASSVSSGSGIPGPGPPSPGKFSSTYGVGVTIDDQSSRCSERGGGGNFSFLNHGEQIGLYGTFAKGEFDAYYSHLVMVFLNIILDDMAIQQLSAGNNLPFLPARGGEIKNFKAVSILVSLLACPRVGLNTVGLRVSYALMRLHAPNVAVLEVLGVVAGLVEKLMAISYAGTLDVAALSIAALSTAQRQTSNIDPRFLDSLSGEMTGERRPSQGNLLDGASDSDCEEDGGDPPKPSPQYPPDVLCTVASEVVVLLQIVSVCTANRDDSVATLLVMLLQTSTASAVGERCGGSSPRESGGLDVRCQNCEMELACLQCLNEGCMHDKSALLCQECDNVFHKSAVKKSHIRLPVLPSSISGGLRSPLTPSASTSKLSISRDNSATITQDLEGVLEMCGKTCPYRALTGLIQELNEFCKAPLLKHGMLDPLSGRACPWDISAHTRDRDGMAVQVLQECLQCVLLAGLRGILDDREARGIEQSVTIFPSLLVSLRTTVCNPFVSAATLGQEDIVDVYRREALFMSEQLRLSELLDSRQDVLHPAPDYRTGEFIQQPPEVSHTSPRRIQLVLLSQCISRFLMPSCRFETLPSLFARKDESYRDMRAMFQQHVEGPQPQDMRTNETGRSFTKGEVQADIIHQAMLFGTDALLVHLLLDSSLHTQLAAVDRQFIIWLLREFAISASSCRSEHTDRIFQWFQWIIRGNVAGKRLHSEAVRTRQKLLLKSSLNKNSNLARPLKPLLGGQLRNDSHLTGPTTKFSVTIGTKEVFATVPSTAPTIGLPIRLLVVQELRLMLGTHCQNLPGEFASSAHSLLDSCGLIRLAQIPLSLSPQSPTFEAPGVYGSVGGIQHPRRGLATVHSSSAWGGGASVAYHSTLATLPLRKHLISTGFIETLLDILLGELCSPSIYRLLRESPTQPVGRASTGDGRDYRVVTELEKEDWWGAFATLGALLTGCDEAKDRLHEHTGIDSLVKFLIEQLDFVTRFSGSLNSTIDHRSVLNTLLIELCIKREQFAPPSKPFHTAVARIPQHVHPPNWGMEDTGLGTDTSGKEQNRLSPLYVRSSTNKYSPSFESSGVPPSGKRAASAAMGADSTRILSAVALSPAYFAQDRTCLQIRYCCRPCPLALTSERFRKAFAVVGTVPPAGPIQPLKHHLPVSRSGCKSADYSDMNVHTSSGIVSSNSSAVLLSRKLMLRRNISTASVHSIESDNRWEVDSTGLTPSALGDGLGRGSFHSAHSLAALSQALTSQVGTPTASVSGDLPQTANALPSKPGQHGRIACEQPHTSELIGKTENPEHLQALLRAPFPPMTQCASGSVPGAYVPLLRSSDSTDLETYSTHLLMLLHHALLVRGGYSENVLPAELLDSPMRDEDHTQCHSRQISEDPLNNFELPSGSRMSLLSMESAHGSTAAAVPVELPLDIQDRDTAVECSLVLRKHLSTFIVPFVSPELASTMESETSHHPAFSRIQVRSPECCELLLAAAIVSLPVNQLFLFSMLSQMLDGNPANAHAFVSKSSTCVALTKLITLLREEPQEKVGYLLSQVLRYSLQQPVLRDLLDVVKRTRSMSGDMLTTTTGSAVESAGEVGLGVDSKSLLFVMGRTAERIAPENFLHFDQESPFRSYVELPHIAIPYGAVAPSEITVCSWVRIGTLSNSPSSAFLQIHSATSDLLISTFFRVVYKLSSSPKAAKDSNEVPCVGTNRPNAQPNFQRITRRVVQLCISFGKSVATGSSNFENGCAVDFLEQPTPAVSELSTIFGQKYPISSSLPSSSAAVTGVTTTVTGSIPASAPAVLTTTQGMRSAHWTLAVESLCGIHRDYGTTADTEAQYSEEPELNAAALTLANCLSHISVPDAIVELDWSEMGDWHLLALSLSAGQLTCSADGVALPILHWTPLGYQYDERSVGIKSAAETSNLKSLPSVHSCAAEAIPLSLGLHHVNFAAGGPFHVTLGGLKYENPAYDTICAHLSSPESSEPAAASGLGLLSLVQAVDNSIRGFSGSVGEVVVLPGTVEEVKLKGWAREGPSNGFCDLKTVRLTGLNATALRVPESAMFPSSKGEPTSSLSFPTFLGTAPVELAPACEGSHTYNVFLTSGVPQLKEKDELFGKSRLAKEKEGSIAKFSRTVQIHQTTALVGAFSKVGGIKALYPLMTADKARMVAALRILASLISHSKDSYQEFRAVEADKVLLYCAVQNPALVTLETLQVLFELIMAPGTSTTTSSSAISAIAVHPGSTDAHSTEAIHRGALLELLVDLVLALPQSSQLARGAIDWLREVCDENLSNCQKVLRSPGLLPVLILLSSWDLPGCELLPRSAALPLKPSSEKTSASGSETAVSRDPSTAQAIKARRDRSLSLGSAPDKSLLNSGSNRAKQVVDISRAAPAAVSVPVVNVPGEASTTIPSDRDDGRLRLMDRVNKEFTQKVLAEERETAETLAIYAERYKMQLSCARFIKLLISGTSGEVAHGSSSTASVATTLSTGTDFSSQHVGLLLSFALVTSNSNHNSDEGGTRQRNTDYVRDKERRQRAARLKRVIYGSFSGIPILRQMDIATPSYWLCSAALVALDALIDATNSALQAQVVSLLKSSFAGSTLQSMTLQLMGSECAEIRERGLRILLLSFSTLDGKLDMKQVSYFDRMHGFQCLAEQLSAHRDGCSDQILQWVLNFIFWQRHHRRISSSSAGGSDGADRRSSVNSIASTSADEEEGFYPIRASPPTSRPSSWEISRQTRSSTVMTGLSVSATLATSVSAQEDNSATTDIDKIYSSNKQPNISTHEPKESQNGGAAVPSSADLSQSATATAASSSIMSSLFSWSNTHNNTVTSKPLTSHAADGIASRDSKHTDASTTAVSEHRESGSEVVGPVTSSVPAATSVPPSAHSETMKPLPLSPREPPLAGIRVNHIDELRSAQMHRRSEMEAMEVPQALDVLFRVLQNSTSPDQVTNTFRVIEQSICTSLSASNINCSNSGSSEFSAAVNQIHLRNAESFFAQKDWLISLCDLLVQYRIQALNTDERDCGASVFSLSESESIGFGGYYGGGAFDLYGSGDESENNSVGEISFNEDRDHVPRGTCRSSVGSADSCSGRISAWHQHLIDQFSNPIYSLIRRLLLQDMATGRVGSARRWNELFRLSLPELYSIQEHLLLDLVGCMSNLSEFCEDINSSVNMLKNIAAMLEQALEKADMTLMFNVRVVTALHSLSYNCSPEVRAKIKETSLPEMRKQYVVRCLLDNTQDYYTKVAALSEISSPLLGYVSTVESKLLPDVNVVMMVLGMMVEACEDLEFLLGGVDCSTAVLNESAVSHLDNSGGERQGNYSNAEDFRVVGSPIPASAFDRVHVLFEVMEVLLECVQNCTVSSLECKRYVSKLVSNIPEDPKGHLLDALLNTFGAKTHSAVKPETPRRKGSGNSTAGGEAELRVEAESGRATGLSRGNSVTGAAGSGTTGASYTWWGGWYTGETATDDPTAMPSSYTGAKPAPTAVADLEAGKVNGGSDSEQVAAVASQAPNSPIEITTQAGSEQLPAMNIKTFITWFCSPEQRELQAKFRAKILTEVRTTHRVFDKLREKNTQRYMRYTRTAQEKRAREKSYSLKIVKDGLLLCKATSDKVTAKFQKDTKSWVLGLNDRIEAGKGHFLNSQEDRFASSKSPLKDSKQSSPSPAFPSVHFSEPLRAYLQQQAYPGRVFGPSPNSLDHIPSSGISNDATSGANTGSTSTTRSSTTTKKVSEATATIAADRSSAGRTQPVGYDAGAALSDLLVAFQVPASLH